MPRTPTPVATEIARWPATHAVLHDDGSGRITIDGRAEDIAGGDLGASRALVIQRVAATAENLGRAVRLTSIDPDGEWELAVHPDGHVDELAARPTVERVTPTPPARGVPTAPRAPTVERHVHDDPRTVNRVTVRPEHEPEPEPEPTATTAPGLPPSASQPARAPRAEAVPRRRARLTPRILAALALLIGVGCAVAIVLTSGPATVVNTPPPTPATPATPATLPAAAGAGNVVQDAIAQARRNGVRRGAAERRRARAALVKRVAARAARRARARRRAAATRAAARRRASATRRQSAPTTAPSAVTKPSPRPTTPPPPPPPPPAAACGEFDLC